MTNLVRLQSVSAPTCGISEKDPAINPIRYFTEGPHKGESYGRSYSNASAYATGRFVYITYISYQRASHLTKEQAVRYLKLLDAGYVGRHFEALR